MKKIYVILSMLVLASCVSNEQLDSKEVKSLIFPVHPISLQERRMNFNEEYIYSYIDSDGNQYVTEWEDPSGLGYNLEKFEGAIEKCSSLVNLHYPKILSEPLSASQPLVFKSVAKCFLGFGYKLVRSNGYRPASVVVVLEKKYSSSGESVGDGGRIVIDSTGRVMDDILPAAHECYAMSKDKYSQGGAGGFIYIDMKSVLEEFEGCLINKGFKVKNGARKT